MLSLIIKKEIHDNLLNLRFVATCVVSIILIISSIIVLTDNYEDELRDYRSRVTTQDNFIDQFGHFNRAGWMAVPLQEPSRFQPLVLGIDREAAQENFVSNPVPVLFSRLDFLTIVTIIMSLIAILFAYNSISGEREGGLLKQMLSTGVSRSTILLGKFIGGNISLLIPFTIGIVSGLLYFTVSSTVQLHSMDYGVFPLLLLASYIYIAAFYGLGILFSTRSHSSNMAVLKSLFAWTILVLVLPNISPFLAAQIYRIPSWTKIQQEVFRITSEERDEIIRKQERELLQTKFPDLAATIAGMNRNEIQAKAQSDAAFKQRFAEYAKDYDELVRDVNTRQHEQAGKIRAAFDEASKYQEKLATFFASISPFSNLIFIATDLTESGIEADNRWESQSSSFSRTLWTYMEARYNTEKGRNPAFGYNDYLDMRDRPHFQYQPQAIGERIGLVLPQVGLLVLFNLLFFAGAFVSFLRYDVR